jgi:hypothetical protein
MEHMTFSSNFRLLSKTTPNVHELDRTSYDESIHRESLGEHGSFVAKLLTPQPTQSVSSL